MSQTDPEPIEVAEGVKIIDAFVEWNLNSANTPEIVAVTSDPIPKSTWNPVSGDPDEEEWIVENEAGLFKAFSTEPQHPPANESPRTTTWELETPDGSTVERVPKYDHETKKMQNRREEDSALGIKFTQKPKGSVSTLTGRVELAQDIIDTYINGSLGIPETSYWFWKRNHIDGYGWHSGPTDRSDYEDYNDAEVVLVKDGIYTWRPKRRRDVEDDDEMFERNHTKRGEIIPCPSCGQDHTDQVPVWENPSEYNSGSPPDFLGCVECNTMLPYDEWW